MREPRKKSKLPDPDPAEGWTKVDFMELVERTQLRPPATRWKWTKVTRAKKKVLCLLDEHGALFQFKLQRGAWLRQLEAAPQCGEAKEFSNDSAT